MLQPLLSHDEPPAFRLEREDAHSEFLIVCDHAGSRIPLELGTLGLDAADLERHIAWDIGAAAVSRAIALIGPGNRSATILAQWAPLMPAATARALLAWLIRHHILVPDESLATGSATSTALPPSAIPAS